MPRRETLNNHNTAKSMTDFLGHSNIFDTLSLSLSLSLSLRRSPRGNNTFILRAGSPASIYGFSCVPAREVGLFFCPRRTTAAGTADIWRQTFFLLTISLIFKTKQVWNKNYFQFSRISGDRNTDHPVVAPNTHFPLFLLLIGKEFVTLQTNKQLQL